MILDILLYFILIFKVSSQYVGDSCITRYDRQFGTCKYINDCSTINNYLLQRYIRPTICGFQANILTICCPNNANVQYPQSFPTLFPSLFPISFPTSNQYPFPTNNQFPNTPNNQYPYPIETTTNYYSSIRTTTPFPTAISERISSQKCKEYSTCKNANLHLLVVGGVDANPQEYPHMALIGWIHVNGNYAWLCGGSLISEYFILTAAHCTELRDTSLSSSKPSIIRLGAHKSKSLNDGSLIEDIGVSDIFLHPYFRPTSRYHDIALIKLASLARLNFAVRPACLWQSNGFPSNYATATGWGRTGYNADTSDILQKVQLNIIDQQICRNFYSTRINRKLDRGIISEQLCAGDLNGGRDTCQGDSGGPLQISDTINPCVHQIIGITSFGVGCGGANSPAVYTRVSSYIDWIESVVWPQRNAFLFK